MTMAALEQFYALPARFAGALNASRAPRTAARLAPTASQAMRLTEWMRTQPATLGDSARDDLPAEFMASFLGPRLHTGPAYFANSDMSLAQAETAALERICAAAGIADGQEIIDAGCGWGALSLFIAERFPRAHITALTGSARQQTYVMTQAFTRGLHNVSVLRGSFTDFVPEHRADRVVSLDWFTRIANWQAAFDTMRNWLAPEGRLVVQMPVHATTPYRVTSAHPGIACWPQAIMPSQGLVRQFGGAFSLESEQHWRGTHAAATAAAWGRNFAANADQAGRNLRDMAGARAEAWRLRWAAFFRDSAAMFGFGHGDTWGTALYVLRPVGESVTRAVRVQGRALAKLD